MQTVHSLVRQEMTRKEFLTIVGFGAASIFGFTNFLQLIGRDNPWQQRFGHKYGLGRYGGRGRALGP